MITELDIKNARELLNEGNVGRLGCILPGGEPYVIPVCYLFKGNSIYVHTMPGLKLEALRANKKVCFQVDKSEDLYQWKSVVAFGDFEEVTDGRNEILSEFGTRFERLTPVESLPDGGSPDGPVVFRIKVREITGRQEK